MTRLFTCSYRAFRPDMGQPVVCSLGLPKWRPEAAEWPRCHLLTPTWPMFNAVRETGDSEAFAAAYAARLERFSVQRIARTLEGIARAHQADNLVLLCHEADPERCHRTQFADWWIQASGEEVAELIIPSTTSP